MICLKQKKDCCVCYEKKDIIVSCKYCVDGKICNACYTSLSKYNQHDKCPCCRQEKWNNYIAVKTKVYPVIDIEAGTVRRNEPEERKKCTFTIIKEPIKNIVFIVKSIWTVLLLWMLGLFTLFIIGAITPDEEPSIFKILIIPLLVGAIETILTLGCCCNRECKSACLSIYCNCDEREN